MPPPVMYQLVLPLASNPLPESARETTASPLNGGPMNEPHSRAVAETLFVSSLKLSTRANVVGITESILTVISFPVVFGGQKPAGVSVKITVTSFVARPSYPLVVATSVAVVVDDGSSAPREL